MPWKKIPSYAKHTDSSPKTVRKWIQLGMPAKRTPTGGILINIDEADEWLERESDPVATTVTVDELLNGLNK